jgi:PadR family transcriptional regulator, regulatory protein PadR
MKRIRRPSAHTLSVFAALTERPRNWQFGYELSQVTGLQSGTLYPILMRLSDRGWLESKWQPSPQRGRPPRHMYRLTAVGGAHARAQLAADSNRVVLDNTAVGSHA